MIVQIISNGRMQEFDLDRYGRDMVVLGRSQNCDIRIDAPYVSRAHGCFFRQNGEWFIADQGSSYGIWHQGQRLTTPVPLRPNTVFLIYNGSNRNDSVAIQVPPQGGRQTMPQIRPQTPPPQPYTPPQPYMPPIQQTPPPQTPPPQTPPQTPPPQRNIPPGGNSPYQPGDFYFDGNGGEYLGMFLLNTLVLGVTCGIMYPWVVCRNMRWRISHTIINGRRLAFTGQTADLWGNWLKWYLLTFITCGIYSYWVRVRIKEWELSHTCYEDQGCYDGQVFEDSFYDGEVGERLGQELVAGLLTTISCGIAYPWMMVRMQKFDMAHSVIGGDRLQFNGDGAGYWGENFLINLLTGITCGIYYPWGICRINRWVYRNTSISSSGNVKRRF